MDNQSGNSSEDYSSLHFDTSGVASIAPYTYSADGSASRAVVDEASSYLSYAEPGSVVFEPLVFRTDNGRMFIFKGAEVRSLCDGILFSAIDAVEEISKEPVVQYQPTGEYDENGQKIVEAVSVTVQLRRRYDSNNALIDTNSGTVYLFSVPGTNEGIWIPNEDYRNKYVFAGDSKIYVMGYGRNGNSDSWTLYSIDKNELGHGSVDLVPLTNSAVFSISWVDSITDDFAIIKEWDDWSTYYLLDLRNGLSPSYINSESYAEEAEQLLGGYMHYYRLPFAESWDYPQTLSYGDYVYYFNSYCVGYSMKVNNGRLELVNAYDMGNNQINGNIKIASQRERDGGIEAVIVLVNSLNDAFIRVFCKDGTIEYELVTVPSEYGPLSDAEIIDGAVWWIGGVNNQNGSMFCCIEPGSTSIKTYPIQGKPIADGDFSVMEDGSFVFWQYLGTVEVGTFSWNPDTPEVQPEMLMMQKAETESIISLDRI